MNWIINLSIYQLSWFICVLGGNGLAWIPLLLLAMHLCLTPCLRGDIAMISALFLTGLVIDGTLVKIGFFTFSSTGQIIIPYWLMVIWLILATLPNHSLKWLKHRLLLSAVLGAVGGPLAYWGGVRLGAADFNWPLGSSILLLSIIWGILWPLIMLLSRTTDGKAEKLTNTSMQTS